MNDASDPLLPMPERIYAAPKGDVNWFTYSGVTHNVEYVRGDLYAAAIEELEELRFRMAGLEK